MWFQFYFRRDQTWRQHQPNTDPSSAFIFPGLLINVFEMVVSNGQAVTFSGTGRTGTFVDGQYRAVNLPGIYSFTKLTVKDGATVKFEKGSNSGIEQPITIGMNRDVGDDGLLYCCVTYPVDAKHFYKYF